MTDDERQICACCKEAVDANWMVEIGRLGSSNKAKVCEHCADKIADAIHDGTLMVAENLVKPDKGNE